uniref:Uncharacterized protein n=1 Tax=Glossina pallidipes TaxID=7398 RepID=A0A1A9ZZM7_GLOPL
MEDFTNPNIVEKTSTRIYIYIRLCMNMSIWNILEEEARAELATLNVRFDNNKKALEIMSVITCQLNVQIIHMYHMFD